MKVLRIVEDEGIFIKVENVRFSCDSVVSPRLDYQPLFVKGARAPPRTHGWTHGHTGIGGGSGTKILGHTDGSLRSPPRVRIFFPEPPLSLCVRRFVPNVPPTCVVFVLCVRIFVTTCVVSNLFSVEELKQLNRNGGTK